MSGQVSLHASAVAVGTAGLLITGTSGAGKSALALTLMSMGACLVADDCVLVSRPDEGPPLASAPKRLFGLIEARGIGLINVKAQSSIRLRAMVDMDVVEDQRLPPRRDELVLDYPLRLFHKVESAHFAPALMHYLRSETDEP